MEYNTTATSKTALASNLVLRKISPLMLADSDSKKSDLTGLGPCARDCMLNLGEMRPLGDAP